MNIKDYSAIYFLADAIAADPSLAATVSKDPRTLKFNFAETQPHMQIALDELDRVLDAGSSTPEQIWEALEKSPHEAGQSLGRSLKNAVVTRQRSRRRR